MSEPAKAAGEPRARSFGSILDRLREKKREVLPGREGIVPARRPPSGSPLSFAQQRLWFLAQLRPDDAAYNMAAAVELRGRLDAGALGGAFRRVVQRHETLRTTFGFLDGEPVQVIHPEPAEPPMSVVDLSGLPTPEDTEVERLARAEASRPFDLERGPLLRAVLVRLGPERHLLLLTMHHLVSDAWSMGVLIREVSALYRCPGDLPPLPVQYADFAVWQRAWLQGEALERPLAWWQGRLAGAPPALELIAERQAGGLRQPTTPIALPATAGLEALARAEGTTVFVALLAGFQVLLHRWTGQEDLVIGTPFANRRRAEVQGLIGFFVNTLPIRANLMGRPSFRELLGRSQEQVLGVHEHQDLPFERIVEELRPERAAGRNPLFQAVLAFQNVPMPALDLPGLEAIPRRVDAGTARFDLTFDLIQDEGWIEQGIFSQTTAARLAAHFRNLLAAALDDPDAPAVDLSLLSAGERHQLVVEWNDRAAAMPRVPIHRLFEEQADLRPDAVAIEDGRRSLSYAELDRNANRLAWHLRELGVGPEVPVALCLERSIEAVETVLAILKAGGAYVPLSPSFPAERLGWIMADSGARVLVTAPGTPVPPIPRDIRTVDLGRDAAAIAGRNDERDERDERLAEDPDPDGLAYILYTSGSTGRPKGVAVTQRNVVRLVRGNDFTEQGPDEAWLLLAPLSFDASTLELWGPLLNGGRLVVFPSRVPSLEEIARTVEEQGVTSLWLTAGLFHQMLDTQPAALRRLRHLLAGGDVLSPPHVRRALEEGIALVNGYGPTEGTTFTCCEPLRNTRETGESTVPIGRPIANTRVHVLGAGEGPVPIGVAGELLAGGEGLARGYLGRPDLTAESFVPDPFSREPGARLYRTGDRVRRLADGRIEFLGRMDRQVKIRGFRIEPGEVEAALTRHPSVADAVVVARETRPGDRRLVAYLVPGEGEPGPAPSELRLFLEPTLPAPLIPSTFVILPAFPLTANGKVDRAALPAPMVTEPVPGRAQPRGPVEELLARLWEEVLGGGRVGAEDGFFDLGGHSLLAARLVSRVREVFEVELPLADLFQAPTVRSLALRIKALRRGEERPAPPVVPLSHEERLGDAGRDAGRGIPLSFAQERLWLFERMDPGSTVFNMPLAARFRGPLDIPALERSLEEVVRRHEVLRTTFPEMAGRPVQRIAPATSWRLPLVDLTGLGGDEARRLAQEQGLRPFDLQREPPLRILLLSTAPDEHELLVTLHHIAADGWSLEVLVRELGVLYRAFTRREPSPLPDLPLQYADWAVWQRRWLEGEALESLRSAWRRLLEGVPTVLELPTDRPRSPAQGYRGAVRSVSLDEDLTRSLEALGRPEGCTLYMTLLAAFQILIGSFSRQDDFLIGTPAAGRSRGETEGMIGFFVNMLALRARLGDRPTFRQLLARVRETTLAAWAHQEMPFDELVRDLRPERGPGRAPLLQVVLAEQESPAWDLDLPSITVELLPPAEVVARYDLSLTAVHRPGGLDLHLTCNADLFEEATAERLLRRWVDLLRAACDRPDARIDDLVEADRAPDLCVHELIEAQARRTPNAEAVRFGDHFLSYADLSLRARCLAHRLRGLGVGPDVRVGLSAEPGPSALVGILGIWMAGGAYVPVDPGVPAARRGFFLSDSGALLLVADSFLLEPGPDPGPVESGVRPENLAYVLYTSGSTGVPKGVAVEHRQLARYLSYVNRVLFGDRVRSCPWVTPLTFDASLKQALAPLLRGETVWSSEPANLLGELACRDRVGVNVTPSLWRALLEGIDSLPGVARVFLGGERLPPELFTRTAAALPGAEVWNLYGPTEATANAAVARLAPGGPVVLGFPIEGAQLHLLDPEMQPVPPGEAGEIHIGGSGVTRGYLGRPELTAERFVPDPFGAEPGSRLYRTGDLGRWTRDGVEFLGRIDHQVKLRGVRIELGEIEARLELLPGVREAAVALDGDRLVAFVVGDAEGARAALAETLPELMVPAAFVVLDRLPRLPSGKVDRAALHGTFAEIPSVRPVVAPRTPTERRLTEIWASVLGRETVSAEDNFFELGGHSIQSIQISHRAAAAGIEVTPRDLLHHPTIAGLAALVDAQQKPQVQWQSALVPDPGNRHEPFTLSDIQQAYVVGRTELFELGGVGPTSYLEADWPELDVPRLEAAWRRLVERHDMLRAVVLPGGRWQILREVPPYELRVEEGDAGALREQMSRRLFEPGRWPLFELRVTNGRRLHIARDLLIGDVQSSEVLLQELMIFYRDPGAVLAPLEVSVRDYALAVDALRAGDAGRKAWEYWRERLAGLPPSPDLPLAPKPGHPAFVRRQGEIGTQARTQLDGRAARAGITPSVLLCAAFSEVLAAWSGGDRFSINVLYSRRLPLHPQVDHLVGNFASTVLLEVDGREATFESRAVRLQERLWGDLRHGLVSGVEVLREANRLQRGSTRAAMPVVFSSILPLARESDALLEGPELVYSTVQTPQVALEVLVTEVAGSVRYTWNSVDDAFPPGFVAAMFDAYQSLLDLLATGDEAWRREGRASVPPVQLARRRKINSTSVPEPGWLLHEPIASTSDEVAVVSADRRLTYGELSREADLLAMGLRPGGLVAVVMEKGWEQAVATLAILRVGAAYLPIDPTLPLERRWHLLEQGDVEVALTQPRFAEGLGWPEGVRVVTVEKVVGAGLAPAREGVNPSPTLAYVLFTSGSTGLPKGVMIDHRGAANTVADINRRFRISAADRVLALSSLSFDLSVWDLFGILGAGGRVVMPDPEASRDPAHWHERIEREGVTVWSSVPALMELYADYLESHGLTVPASLRLVMLSGDWIPVPLPDRLRALGSRAELISLGGATEASIWSVLFPVKKVDPAWRSIPYGRPMANQTLHVLDTRLDPSPDWVPGQIYLGGVGLALGYWKDEAKTRASFIVHPRTGERLYRTGDLGRWLPEGNVELLGREDLQVKIQGYRVEPGEIEAVLAMHPAVREAVVTAVGKARGHKRLVAYVVLRHPSGTAEPPELRAWLEARLPGYMVPHLYVPVAALPLTANGKVDRKALPAPEPARRPSRPLTSGSDRLRTGTETRMARLWEEVLGVSPVGLDEELFALGGDSLLALRLLDAIERELGRRLPLGALFQEATVAKLAALVEATAP